MADFVDDVLAQCDEALATVASIYERDVASVTLSGELLLAVRTVIQDCQSALDGTAGRVKDKYVPKQNWKPYFPLGLDPADFITKIDKELKGGFRLSHPAIAGAFERHQPYQTGKKELGYLHKLSRVNKHSDFSEQRRGTAVEIKTGPGGSYLGEINGQPVYLPEGVIRINGAANIRLAPNIENVTADILVGWNFVDPPAGVLPTLQALARLTREAVEDVHHEAAL